MPKQLITTIVIAVAISTMIGFAFGRASDAQPANAAARASSPNGKILAQLKKLNAEVKAIHADTAGTGVQVNQLGVPSGFGTTNRTLRAIVKQTCVNTTPELHLPAC
jgi:hypothetical protein